LFSNPYHPFKKKKKKNPITATKQGKTKKPEHGHGRSQTRPNEVFDTNKAQQISTNNKERNEKHL
jgi:hypothetical protein